MKKNYLYGIKRILPLFSLIGSISIGFSQDEVNDKIKLDPNLFLNNVKADSLDSIVVDTSKVSTVIVNLEGNDLLSKLNNQGVAYSEIDSLIVTGYISQDDFENVTLLDSLKYFDISGVSNNEIFGIHQLSKLEEIILPDELEDLGDYVSFRDFVNLRKITLPSKMKSIGYRMFGRCYSLESIVIPDNVVFIDEYAFAECHSLRSVLIPDNVTSIGGYAFVDCWLLKSVTLGKRVENLYATFYDTPIEEIYINSDYFVNLWECGLNSGVKIYVKPALLSIYNEEYYGKYQIFPIIAGDIDYYSVSTATLLDTTFYLPGTPSIDIQGRGSLTINGVEQKINNLNIKSTDLYYNYSKKISLFGGNFGTLLDNGYATSNSTSVSLCLNSTRWYFLSMPFDIRLSEITVADSTTAYVIYKYDTYNRAINGVGNNWIRLNENDSLRLGEGFIIQCSNYSEFTFKASSGAQNMIFGNNDKNLFLNEIIGENPFDDSWNLSGNPYPCFFDASYIDFDGPITLWNGNSYNAINLSDDNYIFAPYEAFFIQKSEYDFMKFNALGRNTTCSLISPISKVSGVTERKIINFEISGNNMSDRCRVVINPDANIDYEKGKDAAKFNPLEKMVPQIFTLDINGNAYAINERPIADGNITMIANISTKGIYNLSYLNDSDDILIKVIDQRSGKSLNSNYEFEANDNETIVFNIIINKTANSVNSTSKSDISIISEAKKIIVNTMIGSAINIYNINGALIKSDIIKEESTEIDLTSGAYIIKVNGETFKAVIY